MVNALITARVPQENITRNNEATYMIKGRGETHAGQCAFSRLARVDGLPKQGSIVLAAMSFGVTVHQTLVRELWLFGQN